MNNIGYHTRLHADNTRKIVGGSFGGAIDMDTVNRLVDSQFTVDVRPSGTAVFVDREGREVALYISVDAATTTKGQVAVKLWWACREEQQEADRLRIGAESVEIERLMGHLSHDEIVRRLKGYE